MMARRIFAAFPRREEKLREPVGGRLMVNGYSVRENWGHRCAGRDDRPSRRAVHHSRRQTNADYSHQRRALFAIEDFSRRVRAFQKQGRRRPLPDIFTSRWITRRARKCPPFCGLTAARCGRITRNLRISRSFSPRMATPSCIPIRAAQPATAKNMRKPFSPTGATRIFRTTWPWWITPSRRASPIRTNWAWAAGPTEAYPPTSSLRRRRASRPPFPAPANFLYMTNYGHDHYQRDWETELGRPWEKKALWEKISPFYRVANITTPTLIMGGNIDWNVPIINGEQMFQALKSLGRTAELVVYPDEYHEFSTPSHIKDRMERYLAWYNHYVKGDSAPPCLPIRPPARRRANNCWAS